jgi:plastocyanin
MRVSPQRLVPIAVASFALLLPACGGSSGGGPPAAGHVDVKDNVFSPKTIDVSVGDTVTWDWKGSAVHNVHAPTFSSATQGKGKTFTHTFNTAGTFTYECTIHTGMKGTVNVS